MNLPADFIESMRSLMGEETDQLLSALQEDAPVSIRLNPFKKQRNPMTFRLPVARVLWSEWGYYLDERPSFTFDPLFHSGYYYVQEASSMFVEYLIRKLVPAPVTCLDLSAAPGGKSVSLLSALPEGSLLVSNEIVRQRANVLSETLTRFGHPNCVVINNNPKDFAAFPEFFDLLLVDAPCSGEGMFRKDETAVKEWSPQNVQMCTARQKNILEDVWDALKPGGLLIYSTCTFNRAENEENALWAVWKLGAEFVTVEIDESWGITGSFDEEVNGYRFFPHKTKGEGLFVTVLRKTTPATPGAETYSHNRMKKPSLFLNEISAYRNLLNRPENFDFMENGGRIIALPAAYSETIVSLGEKLKIVASGIGMGVRKGKDFIPSHSLAMSLELNRESFYHHAVTYGEAIAYLRREMMTLGDAPRGFVLLTWQGEPLGFVKNIGNRANNLYPNEWRIRSGYLPKKQPDILSPSSFSTGCR